MFPRLAGILAATVGVAVFCPFSRAQDASFSYFDPPERCAIVSFAAGAVELRLPEGWVVIETPYAHELRVVLAPQRPATSDGMPRDGAWLVWHPRPPDWSDRLELAAMVTERLRLSAGSDARLEPPRRILLDGFPAVRQDFDAAGSSSSASRRMQGFHFIAETDWGLCEMHAVAPGESFPQRKREFQQIVSSIAIREPQALHAPPVAAVRDAEPLIGEWKARGSRMRMKGDGRIVLVADRPHRVQAAAVPGKYLPPDAIRGCYEAEGDMLRVQWADGSQLNFRWRLSGNDLLLTDHEGRISQLQRLLE